MIYYPDAWAILKITSNSTDEVTFKILAGWYGGFARGDSWKLNSGIESFKIEAEYISFVGYSGSTYRCSFKTEGFTRYSEQIYNSFVDEIGPTGTIEHVRFEDVKSLLPKGTVK